MAVGGGYWRLAVVGSWRLVAARYVAMYTAVQIALYVVSVIAPYITLGTAVCTTPFARRWPDEVGAWVAPIPTVDAVRASSCNATRDHRLQSGFLWCGAECAADGARASCRGPSHTARRALFFHSSPCKMHCGVLCARCDKSGINGQSESEGESEGKSTNKGPAGRSLRPPIFFFLRTAPRGRRPPTATNCQPAPTANRLLPAPVVLRPPADPCLDGVTIRAERQWHWSGAEGDRRLIPTFACSLLLPTGLHLHVLAKRSAWLWIAYWHPPD